MNDEGLLRGWLDPDLSESGVRMAKSLQLPRIRAYSSDLMRAVQTAAHAGFCPTKEPALRPWNVGVYAGAPHTVVHPMLQEAVVTDVRIPFGEPFSEFAARFLGFLATLSEDCVLFTHFRNLKLADAWAGGLTWDLTRFLDEADFPPTRVLEVRWS